jgi:hypothetical protein
MRRFVTCIVLMAFLCCQCAPRQYGQYHKADVPIIISDVVGETIDPEERELYDLFQGVDDFEQATFYPIREGGLVAEIQTARHVLAMVAREPQMRSILREYIEEYEWIQSYKEVFERKWQIVDYDALGFPITQREMSRFSSPVANCGCILGAAGAATGVFWLAALSAMTGVFENLFTPRAAAEGERAEELFFIGIGAGVVAGGIAWIITSNADITKAREIIKKSREPRIID